MRSLNVYGGNTFVHGKQVRGVVACTRAELPGIVGGNPEEQRYQTMLRKQVKRVTRALGDSVKNDL